MFVRVCCLAVLGVSFVAVASDLWRSRDLERLKSGVSSSGAQGEIARRIGCAGALTYRQAGEALSALEKYVRENPRDRDANERLQRAQKSYRSVYPRGNGLYFAPISTRGTPSAS